MAAAMSSQRIRQFDKKLSERASLAFATLEGVAEPK
jgi:hypothetical protein